MPGFGGWRDADNILLPDTTHTPVLREVLNGWQISGITKFQGGEPMGTVRQQFQVSGTMATGHALNPDGTVNGASKSISNVNVTGTDGSYVALVLTCDPRDGLDGTVLPGFADRQFVNPMCFSAPLSGKNSMHEYLYIKAPGFQNHDLSVLKNYALSSTNENLKLQFRFSMYNFENHPVSSFRGGDPGLALNFVDGVLDQKSLASFGRRTQKSQGSGSCSSRSSSCSSSVFWGYAQGVASATH